MRNRFFNQLDQLFKGIAVVFTVGGAIIILWLTVELIQAMLYIVRQPGNLSSFGSNLLLVLIYTGIFKLTIRLLIANAVEISLVWLLVLLDLLSTRQGQIISLVLLIWAGIAFFLACSILPISGLT